MSHTSPEACGSTEDLINWVRLLVSRADFEDWKSQTLTGTYKIIAYASNYSVNLYAKIQNGLEVTAFYSEAKHLIDFLRLLREQASEWEGGMSTPKTRAAFSQIGYRDVIWQIYFALA